MLINDDQFSQSPETSSGLRKKKLESGNNGSWEIGNSFLFNGLINALASVLYFI